MILYTENPKNTTRKLLELNEPGKVARYKINTLLHFNGASQVALVVKNPPANAGDVRDLPWVKKIPWKRAWKPTQVLLPGEFHGHRRLVGYSPWDCKESDMTEA